MPTHISPIQTIYRREAFKAIIHIALSTALSCCTYTLDSLHFWGKSSHIPIMFWWPTFCLLRLYCKLLLLWQHRLVKTHYNCITLYLRVPFPFLIWMNCELCASCASCIHLFVYIYIYILLKCALLCLCTLRCIFPEASPWHRDVSVNVVLSL